jgi:transcriptional regulator with XRE-family HTH domain
MSDVDLLKIIVARIRACRRAKRLSVQAFAREAGLDSNALRTMGDRKWNPTLRTLLQTAALIPEDFVLPPRRRRHG